MADIRTHFLKWARITVGVGNIDGAARVIHTSGSLSCDISDLVVDSIRRRRASKDAGSENQKWNGFG